MSLSKCIKKAEKMREKMTEDEQRIFLDKLFKFIDTE